MGKKLRQTTVARGVCKSGESTRLDQRKLQALKFLQLILILYLSSVLYLFLSIYCLGKSNPKFIQIIHFGKETYNFQPKRVG